MTEQELYEKVWDVLVQHGGAPSGPRSEGHFIYTMLTQSAREFRFGGIFGGKLWRDESKLYVTAYPEDITPDIQKSLDRVNLELDILTSLYKGSQQ